MIKVNTSQSKVIRVVTNSNDDQLLGAIDALVAQFGYKYEYENYYPKNRKRYTTFVNEE